MKHLIFIFLLLFTVSVSAQDVFTAFDQFFKNYVDESGGVDYASITQEKLAPLSNELAQYSLMDVSPDEEKAFLINAYNFLVIKSVVMNGVPASVQDVPGFFTAKTHQVAGQRYSLNGLEKDFLFVKYSDPRLHFVLVCGAISCPPIINKAYFPESLDQQLQEQTEKALNKEFFLRYDDTSNALEWSALFDWYAADFGQKKENIIAWVNTYRIQALPPDVKTSVMDYDWSLNGQSSFEGEMSTLAIPPKNSIRYVVSSTIKKGSTETKIFNNLYTQATGDGNELNSRSNFFTTFITSLYGVSDRLNVGVEARYRRVSSTGFPHTPLSVFEDNAEDAARQSLATIGPKIRWAPVPKWGNFSIQSAFWFPLESDLEGSSDKAYIDWNGFTSWTQIMNDFTIGQSFSVFAEVDFLWEDIGTGGEGVDLNRISTPVTLIGSYFPEPKTTLYVLNGFSPYWSPDLDWFYQVGLGAKYQFSRKFEVELLYNKFTNSFLLENNGRASTFNFGIRINT
jgi:hypothetical protein